MEISIIASRTEINQLIHDNPNANINVYEKKLKTGEINALKVQKRLDILLKHLQDGVNTEINYRHVRKNGYPLTRDSYRDDLGKLEAQGDIKLTLVQKKVIGNKMIVTVLRKTK